MQLVDLTLIDMLVTVMVLSSVDMDKESDMITVEIDMSIVESDMSSVDMSVQVSDMSIDAQIIDMSVSSDMSSK
jgi:hypothetical protein